MTATPKPVGAEPQLTRAKGYDEEIERLKGAIQEWIAASDPEMQPLLKWQFLGRSKYFRPATMFACTQAMTPGPLDAGAIRRAMAIEMAHNVSLIVDDILDRSRLRRGILTLHCRFGMLPALMCAGYITAESFALCADSPFNIHCLAALNKRLASAESLQWRLRRQPLGIEDWRVIAREDTGSMFEACACIGTGDNTLQTFGQLVGILYHGCDDVGDVRGAISLGGGGGEDLRDGILTLPAAIAIRDPEVALHFRRPSATGMKVLLAKVGEAVSSAERYLDQLVREAVAEARRVAQDPAPLIALTNETRLLSV